MFSVRVRNWHGPHLERVREHYMGDTKAKDFEVFLLRIHQSWLRSNPLLLFVSLEKPHKSGPIELRSQRGRNRGSYVCYFISNLFA